MKQNKFGRLTVLQKGIREEGNKNELWLCKCSCGKSKQIIKYSLLKGRTTSCGCYGKEQRAKANTKHGLASKSIYSVWEGIKDRCYNKNAPNYIYYGGRGISVCEDWVNSPEVFSEWAYNNGYRNDLQIDREDNDLGYSPDNCRFITARENMLNQRKIRATNTSGFRGVCKYREGFHAYATVNYKTYSIGNHKTAKVAALARDNFVKENNFDLPLNF